MPRKRGCSTKVSSTPPDVHIWPASPRAIRRRDLPQDPTAQIRHPDPGKDEKTRVVGDQRQVLLPLLCRPADKPIPVLALPGRRSEHQASQGAMSLTIAHHVLQVLSHRALEPQIVMSPQGLLHPGSPRRLPAHFLDPQGTQFSQGTINRRRGFFSQGQLRGQTAHPIGRNLPTSRKLHQPALMQLEQQRPRCHVFELTRSIAPTPT